MKTAIALFVVLLWGVAPQLACLMPDQALTPPEMDCCKEMASDCGNPSMTHACCRTVIRTDIGVTAQSTRSVMPQLESAASAVTAFAPVAQFGSGEVFIHDSHAPPPEFEVPSQILRI